MKSIYILTVALATFFCQSVYSQTKKPVSKGNALENKGTGQQNNNTGTGTQKVYNNQKTTNNKNTTNKDERTINVQGDAFFDSSQQVNVYTGVPQRRLMRIEADYLERMLPDKNAKIQLSASNDAEAKRFAKEIGNYLIYKGYTNVEKYIGISMLATNAPEQRFYIRKDRMSSRDSVQGYRITVMPSSE